MSTQDSGEGLAEVFVRGAVFTIGAAVAGLLLRRFVPRGPEVVVVAVSQDDLEDETDDETESPGAVQESAS